VERGWNIFYVDGLDTVVDSVEVEEQASLQGASTSNSWRAPFVPRHLPEILKGLQGRRFSAALLEWWVGWILDSYRSRGYLRAQAEEPDVEFLGSRKGVYAVRIVVEVRPGIRYSLGSMRLTGLPDKTAGEVLQQWKRKPGEEFEYSLVDEFLADAVTPASASVRPGGSLRVCMSLDDDRRAIDITVTATWSKSPVTSEDNKDRTQCSGRTVLTFPRSR
jgi:hypothetical protein